MISPLKSSWLRNLSLYHSVRPWGPDNFSYSTITKHPGLLLQHLRKDDRRFDPILCHFHALLRGGHAEKLPPLRLSLCKFQRTIDAGVSIFTILEVSYD